MKRKFDDIVPKGAKLEKIATGFMFTEGPVWDEKNKCLYFSDIPANIMRKWSKDKGVEIIREPSGKSNGLTLDKQGRLIACEHANRRVSRTEKDGTVITIADKYNGKKLNSPNDVVVKSDGSIYFTDPPYGLSAEFGNLGEQELSFQGVYRLSPDGKDLTLLVDDFNKPNGLAFSPDESILYIDDTDEVHIRAFDVKPDGTIANGRLFVDLRADAEGNVDGMKVDSEGNIFVTSPGGVSVIDPEGNKLGVIEMPEISANVAWGEDDWKTLFITASTSVYKIKLNIPGIKVP
ncbi:TPA: SMP-30/gluconolactonase/LRE family protein [bacterium]|nr:SMP-30/gluconolactonase/LRE family protein [bacterium]